MMPVIKQKIGRFEITILKDSIEISENRSYFRAPINESTRKRYVQMILQYCTKVYIRNEYKDPWKKIDVNFDFRTIWSLFDNNEKDVKFVINEEEARNKESGAETCAHRTN